MAPKAKAKALGRAKAMAVLRRPAMAPGNGGRGAMRRPSHREETEDPWEAGLVMPLHTVPAGKLVPGCSLVLTEADYFGAMIKAAGVIRKVEADHHSSHAYLRLTGTDHEGVLKMHTSRQDPLFRVHICPTGCERMEHGDLLIHALRGRKGKGQDDEPWTTNLVTPPREEVDELAALRARGAGQNDGGGDLGAELGHPGRQSEESARKKDKKKKKKKKERSKEEKQISGKHPARAVQKDVTTLFAGTALDPKERVRKRVMRAAQKYAAKKRAKQSSSSSGGGSTSSSTTSDEGLTTAEGIFAEETKTRAIGERFPGALALETLTMMRQNLLATAGEEGEQQTTRPIALLYFRNLGRKASGAQARELLNITCALDSLLRGRPAQTMDILCQRLKAQEAVLGGTNWAIAQRLELASPDTSTLIARSELQSVQRENFLESRARWQSQASPSGKGAPKGKAKGQADPPRRDERRDDGRKDKGKGGGDKK